ncbi:MAG: NAD(P)H-dependent oxidoreductase subunit E [Deltaproteobacteria bacterium]|nr:NAD(P)H-dependent oxidoreductase subunit E [Deltaproteobacteria bacterium]
MKDVDVDVDADVRARRASVPDVLEQAGGLAPGVARRVAHETGVPEAEVHGVASFYDLLARPDAKLRVCTGLSCRLAGADALLDAAKSAGLPVAEASCLAACDVAPAMLRDRDVVPAVTVDDVRRAAPDWTRLRSQAAPDDEPWRGRIGPDGADREQLVFDLAGDLDRSGAALARARELGPDAVLDALEESGLQGRGGAAFPAHIKWRGMVSQPPGPRYVVLNADESEPGTFKDRELLVRRPDLVLEGLTIAAQTVGAEDVWLYLRGEFGLPRRVLEAELDDAERSGRFGALRFHLHSGQGAYVCGEETALFEALEGRRGLPRHRPPLPIESGLWGRPTLIHNVETIASVPAIISKGGAWFRALGRTGPGTKLYCISGCVQRPGTYEMPLGISVDELLDAAGGCTGTLRAFSPGGAASGFLPASERTRPLDFAALGEAGSMLGSAGVVVLDDRVDLRDAVRDQLRFFEAESCGQCAPCRIGTHYLRDALDRQAAGDRDALAHVADVAWQMGEGSICGLGQTAAMPLTTALEHFPEEFSS